MAHKKGETIQNLCEQVTEEAFKTFGDNLLSVSLFGDDDTQNRLVSNAPGLLFVFSHIDEEVLAELANLEVAEGITERVHLLMFTGSELKSLEYESPLELLHIKTENSTLFGQDLPPSIEIRLDYLQGHIIRELRTVGIQLKSSLVRDDERLYPDRIAAAMNRLYITFKGILFLRGNSKFTGWSWLVSSIESSCSLPELTLSSAVSALENDNREELISLYIPFVEAVNRLLNFVSEMKVER